MFCCNCGGPCRENKTENEFGDVKLPIREKREAEAMRDSIENEVNNFLDLDEKSSPQYYSGLLAVSILISTKKLTFVFTECKSMIWFTPQVTYIIFRRNGNTHT